MTIPHDLWERMQKRVYATAKARGQLTGFKHMARALFEEVMEFSLSRQDHDDGSESISGTELADVVLVCITIAEAYHINLMGDIEAKMSVNENRIGETREQWERRYREAD